MSGPGSDFASLEIGNNTIQELGHNTIQESPVARNGKYSLIGPEPGSIVECAISGVTSYVFSKLESNAVLVGDRPTQLICIWIYFYKEKRHSRVIC